MQGRETDNPSQRERVRQDYLEAMGIQTWFPRCQLLNAKSPRPFDWIEEEAAVWQQEQSPATPDSPPSSSPETSPPIASSYSRPSAADILGKVSDANEATTEKDDKSETIVVKKPKSLQGIPATSRFRLVIHSISDDCLVVAEMPHSGLDQFTRFHQHLLDDLLFSLKLKQENNRYTRGEFIWPLPGKRGLMSQINQDDLSAAEAVCAFLSNQYGLARRKTVLLLGQAAARFVTDPEKNLESLRGVQKGTHSEQYFAITHGLNELMKLSHLKPEAWQDLSPLLQTSIPASIEDMGRRQTSEAP